MVAVGDPGVPMFTVVCLLRLILYRQLMPKTLGIFHIVPRANATALALLGNVALPRVPHGHPIDTATACPSYKLRLNMVLHGKRASNKNKLEATLRTITLIQTPYSPEVGTPLRMLHSTYSGGKETLDMIEKLPAFDVLVDMARNDPQRLETLRLNLTRSVIASADTEQKRKRLEGLQFRVDLERRRARSPLAATIKISEMMCHALADLHRSMVTPLVACENEVLAPCAKILEFPGLPRAHAVFEDDIFEE